MIDAFKKAGVTKEFLERVKKERDKESEINAKIKSFSSLELEKELNDFVFPHYWQSQLITDYTLMTYIHPYLKNLQSAKIRKYTDKYQNLGLPINFKTTKLSNLICFKATIEMILPVIEAPEKFKGLVFKENLIKILDAYAFRMGVVKKHNLY